MWVHYIALYIFVYTFQVEQQGRRKVTTTTGPSGVITVITILFVCLFFKRKQKQKSCVKNKTKHKKEIKTCFPHNFFWFSAVLGTHRHHFVVLSSLLFFLLSLSLWLSIMTRFISLLATTRRSIPFLLFEHF
uniref:Uncharacterized protein n=1 Tax=Trypanosoma vivax (strain Y486) TaxID=1055687 RepID=G0TTE6_TRYVY|nr:hypothetical protein TVY486_0304030 [Trypanosoma vivax Y486]